MIALDSPVISLVLKMEINSQTLVRAITAPLRSLPSFIIIGAQKCGTTSLYNYLIQHPCVQPSFRKELNYFDLGYKRGTLWYKGYFPIQTNIQAQTLKVGSRVITGESTPQYLYHPLAPQRVQQTLPQIKLIVMLRNPVTRAFSHYHHSKHRGWESLSFEDALDRESSIVSSELARIDQDPYYPCIDLFRYSYLSRGIYVEQLERWFKFFPKEQFLILKYEDFTTDPLGIYLKTLDFLNLPKVTLEKYKSFNSGKYSSNLNPSVRDKLINFFTPHNQRLSDFLGINFDW